MSNFYGGLVTKLTRLRNSAPGNPRWKFTLDNGIEFETEPDAQVNFVITETEHGPGHYLKFRLTSNRYVGGIEVMGTHSGPVPAPEPTPEPTPEEAAAEALLEAADDFPSDIPGQRLVKEWLTERAEKYRTGELVIP